MTQWDQILREEWYSSEEPDESVINLANSLKKKKGEMRVLDLGCGAGRNLLFMANEKFEVHGLDLSKTGLDLTKERLRKRYLEAHPVKGTMTLLPYARACFDAVICLSTIYHQKLSGIRTTISEIRRTLKKNGVLLVSFQSKRSHIHRKGVEIEKNSFVRQDGSEKGVTHHLSDEEEVRELLKDFKTVNAQLHERTYEDGYFQSRFIVSAIV